MRKKNPKKQADFFQGATLPPTLVTIIFYLIGRIIKWGETLVDKSAGKCSQYHR